MIDLLARAATAALAAIDTARAIARAGQGEDQPAMAATPAPGPLARPARNWRRRRASPACQSNQSTPVARDLSDTEL